MINDQEREKVVIRYYYENGVVGTEPPTSEDQEEFNQFKEYLINEGYLKGQIRKSKRCDSYGDIISAVIQGVTPQGKLLIGEA